MKGRVLDELKHVFRPEFLNRVDETVVFHALTQPEIEQIAGLMLNQMKKRLQELGVSLEYEPDVAALLAQAGFDAKFGARPLRRAIQRRVEDALSEEMIAGRLKQGDQVKARVQDDELVFEKT